MIYEHILHGCTPTPLAAYLKALAILRLVSEQGADPNAAGCWRDGEFLLRTKLTFDDLIFFFHEQYKPTPLIAPWNAGSGFYYLEGKSKEKDPKTGKRLKTGVRNQPTEATRILELVLKSKSDRLIEYRKAIATSKEVVENFRLEKAPEKGKQKNEFIQYIRNSTGESVLQWMDASLLLVGDAPKFPPLFGTGGNDGNLDFTSNFMQNISIALSLANDQGAIDAKGLLCASVCGHSISGLLDKAIGQFSPGSAGGDNSTVGFKGGSLTNPWDFILMLEGAVWFAASVVRRLEALDRPVLSSPFTVFSRAGISGAASMNDDSDSRDEIWMPLWSRWAGAGEIAVLLGEGRTAVGRRPARDGLDFARSIARLGVDRGVSGFQRFGFLKRSGDSFIATPLGHVPVRRNVSADVLDELERQGWLEKTQKYAENQHCPAAFRASLTRLDRSISNMVSSPSRSTVQEVVSGIGAIERHCATSPKIKENVPPVPRLTAQWVDEADDGSAEFRIAGALASLGFEGRGEKGEAKLFAMRHHLAPVALDGRTWDINTNQVVWGPGPLVRNLAQVLRRRRLAAMKMNCEGRALDARWGAGLGDVAAFLNGQTDDRRISELLPGLSCVDFKGLVLTEDPYDAGLPSAYLLLKPFFMSESGARSLLGVPPGVTLSLPAEATARLAAGDVQKAVDMAWGRLRVLGLKLPGRKSPEAFGVDGARLLAALMVPLSELGERNLGRELRGILEKEEASHGA